MRAAPPGDEVHDIEDHILVSLAMLPAKLVAELLEVAKQHRPRPAGPEHLDGSRAQRIQRMLRYESPLERLLSSLGNHG